MRVPSPTSSRLDHIICPFCESGLLVSRGPGFARCASCGLPLLGSALESLRDIIDLPDAQGVHACGCGGGRVAYRMALDHPDRVERVAALDVLPTETVWDLMMFKDTPWAPGTFFRKRFLNRPPTL